LFLVQAHNAGIHIIAASLPQWHIALQKLLVAHNSLVLLLLANPVKT
jgi:hypothetical protein